MKIARQRKITGLEVGTENFSLDELAFHQKAGFRIAGVDRDSVVRNHEGKIIENGIRCEDMLRLAMRRE